MNIDLRIVFIVLLLVTGFLIFLKRGPVFTLREIWQIFLDFLLLPAMILTVLVFAFLITRTDPMPFLRELAYQLSLQQNVSFAQAVPERLADNMEVISVIHTDTDGDGFEEWVVFYRYDVQAGLDPIHAAVYDTDRGFPPVIFPYSLRPPDRDYLSEASDSRAIDFDLVDITLDTNGPDSEDLLELVLLNGETLSIFRFNQNSAPWDFPRDTPPRYQPIGYFQGSGGVSLDQETKQVTVIDRGDYDRSQLVLRSVYALQGDDYWANVPELGTPEDAVALAAPIISTIDFLGGPPTDIFDTVYPEKIVLGFYAAACGAEDDSLCRNAELIEWEGNNFLTEEALIEYNNNNAGYFGLPAFAGNQNILVSILRYYPEFEIRSAEPLVTGPQPQLNVVEITFTENRNAPQSRSYLMQLVDGQWKIAQRLPLLNPLAAEPLAPISTSP